MTIENARLETVIKLLDAKVKIAIWESESKQLFDGYVYQLYDNTTYNNMYITHLRFDAITGITAMVTDKWQK